MNLVGNRGEQPEVQGAMKAVGRMRALAFAGCAGLTACQQQPARDTGGLNWKPPEIHRGEIRRTLLGSQPATRLPGWETRLYLIEYGAGASAPLHVHPVVGVGQVLEGSFISAFGSDRETEVRAGQGFVDPPGVAHRVFRNASAEHPLRFLIAYTIQPEQPIFYPGATLPAAGG